MHQSGKYVPIGCKVTKYSFHNTHPYHFKILEGYINPFSQSCSENCRHTTVNLLSCDYNFQPQFNTALTPSIMFNHLIIAVLLVLPFVAEANPSIRSGGLPECSSCRKDFQCESGKCWGRPKKCVENNLASFLRCGFKKECEPCEKKFECATKKCKKGLCVFKGKASFRKCRMGVKKGECERCKEDDECEQGKCWGKPRKCTDGTLPSLQKCFLPECAACSSDFECSTKKCWNKKCVFNNDDSIGKCFKKAECELCMEDEECEQGKCWGKPRKCTDGTLPSLQNCFLPECAACTSDFECSTKKCWNKKCVFNNDASIHKCF